MSFETTGQMSKMPVRIAFLVLVIGGSLVIGMLSAPGEWYANLNKPSFNPPTWVFGPVWTVLYLLIAMAGWRTWEAGRSSGRMTLWWVQMALNFLWPLMFFTIHQPCVAMVVILVLLATILLYAVRSWNVDRVSALAFVPYAAWICFASVLNLSLAILN